MRKLTFYYFIIVLVVIDSYLLSKPNLLGKIGLVIYKYYYLRTFPRALLTVCAVAVGCVLLAELISVLVKRGTVKRVVGVALLALLTVASFAALVKTGLDFTAWTYSHTGLRFRFGAFLLPTILIMIFTNAWIKLPKVVVEAFPESPVMNEPNIDPRPE